MEAVHWKTKEVLVRGCACGDRDGVAPGSTGIAHVSCLAEPAKILIAEVMEDNLSVKMMNARWARWDKCSLCEQEYHGVVRCALGWACWKTFVGRPETDQLRSMAVGQLGSGLCAAEHHEAALSVREAELSMMQRIGDSEYNILVGQGNLAGTYRMLGQDAQALQILRDVYSGYVKLCGEESRDTLLAANNYAVILNDLNRFEEAKGVLRKEMPVARRVLGNNVELTLVMRRIYAQALGMDDCATLDDLRESVVTLEEIAPTAQRVLGGAHPTVVGIEQDLRRSRAALRARETPPPGSLQERVEGALREGRAVLRARETPPPGSLQESP